MPRKHHLTFMAVETPKQRAYKAGFAHGSKDADPIEPGEEVFDAYWKGYSDGQHSRQPECYPDPYCSDRGGF